VLQVLALLREYLRLPAAAVGRLLRRASLFVSVASAIITGAALAIGVTFAIGIALHAKVGTGAPAPIDVLKTALTVVAGVGGAVALVVAYRRQKDLEQGRFVERFGAAAAQLGDPDVAVRIAGVYAMAGVADDGRDFLRRQQCIDVLCGYLRLPYKPEQGGSHVTELVTTTTRQARPPITSIEEEAHERLRQNDREVRRTIVRVIVGHLRGFPVSWSRHSFDFTDVYFEDAKFFGARFNGDTKFDGATFSGKLTAFDRAKFSGFSISFKDATFSSEQTNFRGAKFSGPFIDFDGGTFLGDVDFSGAEFDRSRDDARQLGRRDAKKVFSKAHFNAQPWW
jgi:hypothetical protein